MRTKLDLLAAIATTARTKTTEKATTPAMTIHPNGPSTKNAAGIVRPPLVVETPARAVIDNGVSSRPPGSWWPGLVLPGLAVIEAHILDLM
jgi:hypothetical protein